MMADAFISRRGSGIKIVTVKAKDEYTLVVPELIGAKNAIITLYTDMVLYDMGTRLTTSITIENGAVTSHIVASSNGYVNSWSDSIMKFDSSTGTVSKKNIASVGDFIINEYCYYKVVIY